MAEDDSAAWYRTGLVRQLTASLLVAFAAVSILHLDPLGIKTATNAQSEFIYQRFFASYVYDMGPSGAGPDDRRATAVVLIDQNFLDVPDDDWPARYDTQADLVDAIAGYEPAAMFLDIAYLEQHDSDDALARYADTLGSYRGEHGPWLSLARLTVSRRQRGCRPGEVERVASDLVDEHAMLPPIRDLRLPNGFVGWDSCGTAMPLFIGRNPKLPTPAMAMFERFCQNGPNDSTACQNLLAERYDGFMAPMNVQWGRGASQAQLKYLRRDGTECRRLDDGFWSRLVDVAAGLPALLANVFRGSRQPGDAAVCAYIDVVYAGDLHRAANAEDESADAVHDSLRELLAGRYVFVSTDLRLSSDMVTNPIRGEVPGVFLHAAMFDNLVTRGEHYVRPPTFSASSFGIEMLAVALATFGSRLLGRRFHARMVTSTSLGARFGLVLAQIAVKLLLPLALLLLAVTVSLFMHHAITVSVPDWAGAAVLAFIVSDVSIRQSIDNLLRAAPPG